MFVHLCENKEMKNLSNNKVRITLTERALSIHTNCIKALQVCGHLIKDDLMSDHIRRKIFEDLCNPHNIVTCDFKFTEKPNMN